MYFYKAFDKVSHRLLLHKIECYGIKGLVIKWIEIFLIGAVQQIIINGSYSTSKLATSGVPQGSVLGLVLFRIYVNDMPEVVRSMVKLFADDTKLYSEARNLEDHINLQKDIDKIDNWLMTLNLSKCKHLEIGNVASNSQFSKDKGLTTESKMLRLKKTSASSLTID